MAAAFWPVFTNGEASQLMVPGSMRERAHTARDLFLTAVVKCVYISRDFYPLLRLLKAKVDSK